MKLKFIGTGNVESKRCSSSLLLDNILFDIGNGVSLQLDLFNINLDDIRYLAITHFHSDHIYDIVPFLLARTFRGYTSKLTIIGPKGLKDRIIFLLNWGLADGNAIYNNFEEKWNMQVVELEPEQEYIINDKILKTYKLDHGYNKEVMGYTYDNKVAYLTDTKMCYSVYKLASEINNVIIDTLDIKPFKQHLNVEEVMTLAKSNPNNNFYAIHRDDYDTTNYNDINFPNDGDELIIE